MNRKDDFTDKPVDPKYQFTPAEFHKRRGCCSFPEFVAGIRTGEFSFPKDAGEQARVAHPTKWAHAAVKTRRLMENIK